jgi:hypothetical protein
MADEQIIQVPSELVKAEMRSITKDAKLTFTTQQEVPADLLTQIIGKVGQTGWLSFLVGERRIDVMDILSLPEITIDKGEKTKAQRLRAVIYVLWEHEKKEKLTTFSSEEYYNVMLEKFIDHVKSKLPKDV